MGKGVFLNSLTVLKDYLDRKCSFLMLDNRYLTKIMLTGVS